MNDTVTKKGFRERLVSAGPYLTAFFIPVLVMVVVFIERGFWPIGDKCFLRTDMYHQYVPFLQELRNKFASGGSLFYSWNIGGGTNFWTLSAYYLASPTNLLLAVWPRGYVIEYATFMIVNKIGLCSLTMAYYLNKRHDNHGLAAYPAAFFGTFYALSGYMAAYNWNLMWLDCLALFPIVILGLERLVKENKGLLYSVALGLTILSNYYIAIMVCMGVAVYCFFLLGTEREMLKDFGTKLLKFIGYTLLAVALSMVFLLPYVNYFKMTASAGSTFRWEWYSYFPVFDMAARHLMNVQPHTGLDHWPNIYCGIAVFLFIPFYYMNRRVTLREKIGYTIVLIFFYFSFSTRAMDYIWHGFHIPNSLPCRQAFIYIFILMTMSYRGFRGLKDRTFREIGMVMLFALGFTFAAEKLMDDKEIYTNYVFYVSALFIVLYTIVLYVYRKGRSYKDILLIVALSLAAIETCVNTSITSVSTVRRTDYKSYDSGVEKIMDEIRFEEDGAFYRVEKTANRTKNDGAWLNYPSISTFSSCANSKLTDFYTKLGLESSFNAYGSKGQTPFTNMLMGVKYSIAVDNELPENDRLYELYDTNGANVWIYRNKYALSLGYVVPRTVMDQWTMAGNTPLVVQNRLAKEMNGGQEIFEDVTPSYTPGTTVSLLVPDEGTYYAYIMKGNANDVEVTYNGKSKKYDSLNRSYTIVLGQCDPTKTITFKNVSENSSRNLDITLYRLNEEALIDTYKAFSRSEFVVDKFKDTRIDGHIDVQEAGLFLTTVAWEEGWDVYLDGEKIEPENVKDAYIGFNITEGRHEISLRYHVPCFVLGLLISLAAAAAMVLIGVLSHKKEKKQREKLERIERAKVLIADSTDPSEGPVPAAEVTT
ncbi:MAG: YfhO family protein [Lachnospiraceae bacterium]|nr:YfhO family protein [Lachnospiraceae bacterium]